MYQSHFAKGDTAAQADQPDLCWVAPLVNRSEIVGFIKTASQSQLDAFLHLQLRTLQQAAQLSSLAHLCCLYDIVATACNAAAEQGIVMPPYRFPQSDHTYGPAETATALRLLFVHILATRDAQADTKGQLVRRAKLYIEEHHADPNLSLAAVAASIGVGASYLSTLFNRESAESFSQYLNSIRIRHTAELLKSTPDSLAEIAGKVGYNDPYYLSRTFKKALGVSPREFKSTSMSRKMWTT